MEHCMQILEILIFLLKTAGKLRNLQFRGIETFWAQKVRQGKLAEFTKILNYNKSSCSNTYYSQKELKHFDLETLVFDKTLSNCIH